jgi:cytochrome c oxidase cbb3-type subunit 3
MKSEDYKDEEKVKIYEDEQKILLDHDYDGIRELDNPLPKWWLYSFYLTIIFAVPYYVAHTFMDADSINDEFKQDVASVTKIQQKHDEEKGQFDEKEFKVVISSAKFKKIAKKTYKRKCKACHGAEGQGGVGPNLADNFWIHGDGSLAGMYKTINYGVADKGMPAWGATLGKEKVYAVLKYIADFKGTKPKNPKPAQGKEYK